MKTGILLLNFGEPAEPTSEAVTDYLTRIFYANASLEGARTDAERWERSRELAERRAPALLREYEEIGGSPHDAQAISQAQALESELRSRGFEARTYVGMQFTPPFIAEAARQAQGDGVEQIVGLPVYPLCGPSTTVAALEEFHRAISELGWRAPVRAIAGWHRHPRYTRLRVENIKEFVAQRRLSLADGEAAFLFSVHGTPWRYIEQGSRYVEYVAEHCAAVAALLGLERCEIGYQNHSGRGITWTEPDVADVIVNLEAERVVVEPISFMHEQSETLYELDVELRAEAEKAGLEFHRVPVPYDHPGLPEVLADLIEPFLAGIDPGYYRLGPCACQAASGVVCLNAPR